MVQRIARNAARGEIGEHVSARLVVRRSQGVRAVVQHAMRFRVGRIGDADLAAGRHADDPRRHAVGVQGVLPRPVIPRCEHDGDAAAGDLLGRFVDRILGVERAGRSPGIVHHLDVVLLLVVEDVIEAGQRPEDEQDVAGADADETGARGDARVIAVR